jgi:CHAD domain-containing protein
MKASLEQEVKLRPGPRFSEPRLQGEPLSDRTVWSRYYDTDDLRLARGSITLRHRTVGEKAVWQLKLGSGRDRTEVEWPGPTAVVPDEIVDVLVAHTRGRVLTEVAVLRTDRRGTLVQARGEDIAEVVHDRVDVIAHDEVVSSFAELEIELVDGTPEDLKRIEKRLRRAGAIDPDGRPKLFQALDYRKPKRGKRKARSRECLRRNLEKQYRRILRYDPLTRLDTGPEALHKQRVAVRRLRAMLRAGRPLLDREWADGLRDSLRRVGTELGEVRDLDVQITRLSSQAALLGAAERPGASDLITQLHRERDEAHAAMVRSFSEPWYLGLLDRLEEAFEKPVFAGHGSLGKRARREHRRTAKLQRKLPSEPSDRELHALRKSVKRSRYAAELASACGAHGFGRYIKKAKTVQDVLGDHQDAVVAIGLLQRLDDESGRPLEHLAVAELVRQNDADKRRVREQLPDVWRRFVKAAP